MNQTRKPRGIRATEEGLKKLQQAKAAGRDDGQPLTYERIAELAGVDKKTVERFFRGEPKDKDSAFAIITALGLENTEVLGAIDWQPPATTAATPTDWRHISHNQFNTQVAANRQRRLATERGFELDIYVPLGLVARQQQSRRGGWDIFPEGGMEAYQPSQEVIEKTYQHQEFLREVIGDGCQTQGKRIAIIGEPGAGKTTLSEKIGAALMQHNALPIFIPLSNLSGDTLQQYLLTRWCQTPITEAQLQELLQTQPVWLLLDGLDEMASASPVEALNKISQDLSELAAVRVVLTCRLNVWDASTKNLPDFQTYKTQEFACEQVRDFILAWFGRAEEDAGKGERGEQLWQKLKEAGKERLRDLVKNPLRLALLCQIWDTMPGELPETQASLYERFTRYHYEWKQKEFPTTRTQRDELNAALAKLARQAIAVGKTRFRIGEKFAYRVMGEELFNLAWRLGWLNQVDRDKQTDEPFYSFYHASFQEYFAALAIDNWQYFLQHRLPTDAAPDGVADETDRLSKLSASSVTKSVAKSVATYRIFEPQWKQVILLWLGRDDVEREEKEKFIQALVEFEDGCREFYEYRAYFLAAAGIAEVKDCSLADEIVGQIVKWGCGDFDTEQQEWRTFIEPIAEAARAVIPETYRPKAIAALVQLLASSQDVYTRGQAAESLGEIDPGNRDAIAALVQLLASSQDEITRGQAAESLGKIAIGNSDAIAALVQLLASSQDEDTRRLAAYSLGKIDPGNTDAIAALVQLLASSQDVYTRGQAAESLGEIDPGNRDAIAALVQLLASSLDKSTRWRGAESLKKILTVNHMTPVVTALKDYLSNESYKNDFQRFNDCYEILWHCAQNLPYPAFYQAWHQEKNQNTKPSINLSELPALLGTAINNNVQIICIDASKFIDPDNPALEIYDSMLEQGCPECQHGEPETMPKLKRYWHTLRRNSDKIPFLVFYKAPAPRLSDVFLNALSKFDGNIALVGDSCSYEIQYQIQYFSPIQDNLIADIVAWMREKMVDG